MGMIVTNDDLAIQNEQFPCLLDFTYSAGKESNGHIWKEGVLLNHIQH